MAGLLILGAMYGIGIGFLVFAYRGFDRTRQAIRSRENAVSMRFLVQEKEPKPNNGKLIRASIPAASFPSEKLAAQDNFISISESEMSGDTFVISSPKAQTNIVTTARVDSKRRQFTFTANIICKL